MIKTALLDERYDDAQKYTEELVRIEPGDLVTMMQMGKAFMEQKKFKEAASWFKKVKDRLPSYPKIGYYKSKIELYLGNLEQAKLDVEADMKENGDYEEGLVLKGDILAKEEKYIEAEKIYKEAQKLNLKSVDAILGLAYISFKKQQFEIALDLYKRAEREQPGNPQVHRQLGEVYRFLGQGALAIEAYKMYLDLLPNAPDKDQIESHIRILE
jgi:tetratricopeptide (TPR) repeat protein